MQDADEVKRRRLEEFQNRISKQVADDREKLMKEWGSMNNVVDDYEKLYGMFKKY